MLNIVILILLLHFLNVIINKPKFNTLNCGIFSWAGKDVNKFSKIKFNILGIMNETRGKHSCGITIDGNIYKGIDKFKVFRDFINNNKKLVPKQYPIVIGHTRHATVGKHTEENAHPFGFKDENDDSYKFIGVHNGSLHRHHELADKYNVEKNETKVSFKNKIKTTIFRNKIDSEILLEAIYKNKNFKVLNDYNGAAALVFYNVNEPNVIYCYHGSSKRNQYCKTNIEERPLFYYKESKNSLYISSIRESLELIGGTNKTIGMFQHNIVYKITDGDISNAIRIKVDRSNSYIDYFIKRNINKSKSKKYNERNFNSRHDYLNAANSTYSGLQKYDYDDDTNEFINNNISIKDEKPPHNINSYKGKIYFNKLHWLRNGHKVTGIYTYIDLHGFYYLSHGCLKTAEKEFKKLIGKNFSFVNNDFTDKTTGTYIPFPSNRFSDNISYPMSYFIEGIQIRSQHDFSYLMDEYTKNKFKLPITLSNSVSISNCAKHPVINLNLHNSKIYFDGKLYTGQFSILGSQKIYNIIEGELKEIKSTNTGTKIDANCNNTKIININHKDNKEVSKQLLLMVNEDLQNEKKDCNIKPDNSDENLIIDVNKMFTNIYASMPSFIKQIQKYPNTKLRKDILDYINTITLELDDLNELINSKNIIEK